MSFHVKKRRLWYATDSDQFILSIVIQIFDPWVFHIVVMLDAHKKTIASDVAVDDERQDVGKRLPVF